MLSSVWRKFTQREVGRREVLGPSRGYFVVHRVELMRYCAGESRAVLTAVDPAPRRSRRVRDLSTIRAPPRPSSRSSWQPSGARMLLNHREPTSPSFPSS